MFDGFFTDTELIGVKLGPLRLATRNAKSAHFRSLLWIALRVEKCRAYFRTRQVLAIVEVIVLATLEVVHSNKLPLHCIFEVLTLNEDIRAKNNLVLVRNESPLHESIAGLEANVQQRLQSKVTCKETI